MRNCAFYKYKYKYKRCKLVSSFAVFFFNCISRLREITEIPTFDQLVPEHKTFELNAIEN